MTRSLQAWHPRLHGVEDLTLLVNQVLAIALGCNRIGHKLLSASSLCRSTLEAFHATVIHDR